MPITFDCQRCGMPLQVSDESAGGRTQCPHCAIVCSVPGELPPRSAEAGSGAEALPEVGVVYSLDDPEELPEKRPAAPAPAPAPAGAFDYQFSPADAGEAPATPRGRRERPARTPSSGRWRLFAQGAGSSSAAF